MANTVAGTDTNIGFPSKKARGKASLQFKLEGEKRLLATIKKLDDRVFRKYARAGISKVGTMLKKRMKKRAPDASQTGTEEYWSAKLKARLADKVPLKNDIKVRPSSKWDSSAKMASLGIVGVAVGPVWGRNHTGQVVHLLEFGHRGIYWGRGAAGSVGPGPWDFSIKGFVPGGRVQPYPFVGMAFDDVRPHYMRIMKQAIWGGMARDLRKNKSIAKK